MALSQSKSTKIPTSFLSLPLELRQEVLIQSYRTKRPDREFEDTKIIKLLEQARSPRDVRLVRFAFINSERRRRREQRQERDLEYYRMDNWVDRLAAVHEGLREDLVFVQGKWREAFGKEIQKILMWRTELGRLLKEKEMEYGL